MYSPSLGPEGPYGYQPLPDYLPQPGYVPQYGYKQEPPRVPNNAAMWAHLGALLTWCAALVICAPLVLFCFVTPLIIRSNSRNDQFARHHATQSLNSTLTGLTIGIPAIIFIVLAFLMPLTIPLAILLVVAYFGHAVARVVYAIIGATRAHAGQPFQYPHWVAIRFVEDDSGLAAKPRRL